MSKRDALVFKVTLDDPFGRAADKPYRLMAVGTDCTLYEFAHFIVDSFDFDFDHLFGFYNDLKNYGKSTEGYEYFGDMDEGSEFEGVKSTKVSAAFGEKGKQMLFLFDYGDHWCFIVELKDVVDAAGYERLPLLLECEGEAPPQYGEVDEDWDDHWSEDWPDDDWDDVDDEDDF